ncbi:MAG: lamin tail domain-containing protein, partial [Chitinophagaceae bacterium]|nr:lamin tail domain-containing protein [Chitinophagaceae bacterium]
MKKIFTILFTLVSLISFSQSTTLVISQVYGGGGNSGAPYNADFVELHNVSSVSQSTSGLSVQYASSSATGTWTGVFALPTANIPAGGYFLIRMSTIGTNGVALPTPDAEPSAGNEIAMSSTNGRVALVNGVTALSGCPTTNVIDLVGFGSSVCFETAATPALSNTTAALRNNNGCTDTDNNSSDFTVAAPAPRNSSSTASVCGASSPTLSATALTAFGGVCINTTAGPNSFTITGTSLNTTNVTVGALNGFTYSTSAAGTYTTSLSLTQPGGSFTQEIFVKFTPTAVQTYDGDIAVGGGGATSINVAASGSGINAPALTTGAASNITQVSATLAGTITSEGCSAVTAYGIEYSTTAGFPNGTGTPVASTNISGGNFSSNITGLTAATTYYYHAYATNTQGTGYGTEKSFTTSTASTPGMVISQVYGGGGNSSATYNQDFVELFNRSTATIDISGWSVQYASATGPGGAGDWAVTTIPASTTVAPGKYFLIALATGATGGALPTPDLTNTAVNMSGSAGKVALVNNAVALNGTTACSSATVVDVIGYGSTATCSETSPFITTGIDNTKSIFRKMNGCTDDNNNSTDFEILAVSPRNSASAANVCGAASPVLTATALTAFGNVCINTTAGPNSFTITGTNLTAADVTVAALAGFTYSTTSGGTYTTTLNITQPGGSFTQEVFVKFTPTAVQSYNGDIAVGGGGATSINVAAAGAGINISVTTGASSAVTSNSATLAGTATTTCAAITAYGIEYSTTNNFPNGSGTQVPSTNINGSGNYTSDVTGLTAATTYYYKA